MLHLTYLVFVRGRNRDTHYMRRDREVFRKHASKAIDSLARNGRRIRVGATGQRRYRNYRQMHAKLYVIEPSVSDRLLLRVTHKNSRRNIITRNLSSVEIRGNLSRQVSEEITLIQICKHDSSISANCVPILILTYLK